VDLIRTISKSNRRLLIMTIRPNGKRCLRLEAFSTTCNGRKLVASVKTCHERLKTSQNRIRCESVNCVNKRVLKESGYFLRHWRSRIVKLISMETDFRGIELRVRFDILVYWFSRSCLAASYREF